MPVICRCLKAGFTMQFNTSGHPLLAAAKPTASTDWGCHEQYLQAAARAIDLPDRELIDFLTYGCYDYSTITPPISWFAPHTIYVLKQWTAFANCVEKEIRLGWLQGPYDFIPTVTFRVLPGTGIPKTRQHSKFRTIWNASVSGPDMDGSAVSNAMS